MLSKIVFVRIQRYIFNTVIYEVTNDSNPQNLFQTKNLFSSRFSYFFLAVMVSIFFKMGYIHRNSWRSACTILERIIDPRNPKNIFFYDLALNLDFIGVILKFLSPYIFRSDEFTFSSDVQRSRKYSIGVSSVICTQISLYFHKSVSQLTQ